MKRIRYLTLLWMLFSGIVGWAQDNFNPDDPAEPGQLTWKLTLKASPNDGGSVSGSGNYVAGTSVTVTASAHSGWTFVNWTNEEGTVVASTNSYTLTKAEKNETLTANFAFNPGGPDEPAELPYRLNLMAGDGGSVSGSGLYMNGTSVNISASAYSGFEFDGWYNTDGTCYSTDAYTTYTMGSEPVTLTARFTFNPESPAEPGEVNLWRLKLKAQDGGTVWADKYNLQEGETTTVRASANSGYYFDGWYRDGVLVSATETFTYAMPASTVTLEAHFVFSPDAPSEPGYIEQRKFSFTLKNIITKPGATVQFPILLTPLATLGNITLQLNFDPRLNVDIDNVAVAQTSTDYQLTREAVTEGDVAYDEGMTSYRFILTGGSMVVGEDETPTVTPILTFPVIIPTDIETSSFYKISINQISMTLENGDTQTAGTRNGRVSVYKNGDANGDNVVDALDASLILQYVAHKFGDDNKDFIKEAADTNNGDEVDALDASLVLQHAAKKIDLNEIDNLE